MIAHTKKRIAIFTILLAGALPAGGADLLEIYRLAQSSDAQYAAARATWSAGRSVPVTAHQPQNPAKASTRTTPI
ncbi:hypothetical protein D3C83_74610 [compost metagenome]